MLTVSASEDLYLYGRVRSVAWSDGLTTGSCDKASIRSSCIRYLRSGTIARITCKGQPSINPRKEIHGSFRHNKEKYLRLYITSRSQSHGSLHVASRNILVKGIIGPVIIDPYAVEKVYLMAATPWQGPDTNRDKTRIAVYVRLCSNGSSVFHQFDESQSPLRIDIPASFGLEVYQYH